MRELSVKKVEVNGGGSPYRISYLGDKGAVLPSYGVVFPDGLTIECAFGGHMFAYSIGAQMFIARHFDKEVELPFKGASNAEDLFYLLEASTTNDGVIKDNIKDFDHSASKLFSTYRVMGDLDKLTVAGRYPELTALVKDVTFIHSSSEKLLVNEAVKKYARNWVKERSDLLWAIRVLSYMYFDDDFFVENSKAEFSRIFKRKFGVNLPTIAHFKENRYREGSARALRFLPDSIGEILGKERYNEVQNVISDYPFIRKCLGVTVYTGLDWSTNFITNDLDWLINLREGETTISEKFRELMESKPEVIRIVDRGVDFNLPVSLIQKISYSPREDAAYLEFITPVDLLLREVHLEGTLVRGFVIDKEVEVSAIK